MNEEKRIEKAKLYERHKNFYVENVKDNRYLRTTYYRK